MTLQMMVSCIQSNIWLSRQPEPARYSSYVYFTQLDAIWAFQQAVNMVLIPMLTLRKFNGQANVHNRYLTHQLHTLCMLCSKLVCPALAARASLCHFVTAVVLPAAARRCVLKVMPWRQVHWKLYLQALLLF